MTKTTDFISELIRAANRIDRLGDEEKARLLERAFFVIREGRKEIGTRPNHAKHDAAMDLITMSRLVGRRTNAEVQAALLDAAEMIRTIKILIDAKEEVSKPNEIDPPRG